MKRLVLFLIILASTFIESPAFAGVNDFHFSDFAADYYLTRDENGVSHLKVKEQLTAEFPNFAQNKGIRRLIPMSNQDGKNVTLPGLHKSNIKITRNGVPEPIWDISREGDYYSVETGTDDYVMGTQVYSFEYEFEKVVTDFKNYQELYWDTNGNGWSQRFDSLTASLHFDKDILDDYAEKSWCYVGRYGVKGQDRCEITETEDGVKFTTKDLKAGENLTFDVEIKPGTFNVPEPEKSYIAFGVLGLVVLLCGAIITHSIRKYQNTAKLIKEYKGIFTAPEYQPQPDYNLAEMAEIYLGDKKDVKVGILLDLIVNKKVEIHKKENAGIFSKKWSVVVKSTAGLTREEEIILEILNGGQSIKEGDEIEIKNHNPTTTLMGLGKSFDERVLAKVKADNLVLEGYRLGNASSLGLTRGITMNLFLAFVITTCLGGILLTIYEMLDEWAFENGKIMEGLEVCSALSTIAVFVSCFIVFFLSSRTSIIGKHTSLGLKMSKYMEGLKLYISMAEADRLRMLQSVNGADTSAEGIVKIYEKLLPYAAVFGLEKSWMEEMEKYCKIQEIEQPDYLLTGITVAELSRSMRSAAGYASSSGHTIAGGGSFSSSSSGGGGGGFSGGGGGGGGGGGR